MLMKKFQGNPVMDPRRMPEGVLYTFNPGAIRFRDEYLLLMDVSTAAVPIVLWLARSRDGIQFVPDPMPVNWPAGSRGERENCVYDPRITRIGDRYLILYASQAPGRGVRTGIVETYDFVTFRRIDQAETGQNNRNSVLFPELIGGRYARLDRPMGDDELEPSDLCISFSDDLVHWQDSQVIAEPRPDLWDSHKVGGGAVPIRTSEGWLVIYHGVDRACNGFIYRLGTMLLDLAHPEKVIARGEQPILWADAPYEFQGRVDNVVFTCNALVEPDGDTVRVYYGAADTCIGLATASLCMLVEHCRAVNPYLAAFYCH